MRFKMNHGCRIGSSSVEEGRLNLQVEGACYEYKIGTVSDFRVCGFRLVLDTGKNPWRHSELSIHGP